MSLGITKAQGNSEGEISGLRIFVARIAFDNSYPTGGYPITPAQFTMGNLHGLNFLRWNSAGAGYVAQYNGQTKKLQVFESAGFTPAGTISKPTFTVKNGTALANGTINLDADAASANVVGGTGITADRTLTTTSPVGTPTLTGTAVAAAALAEVANGVDLSALVGRFLAVGF